MRIHPAITRDRISHTAPDLANEEGSGAVASFLGIVRPTENQQPILGLFYEAYQPMALKLMRRILMDLTVLHPCQYAVVVHRIGFIPSGEIAIAVHVASRHRTEAFNVVQKFMDRLKQDVPIWKVEAAFAETKRVA